MKGEIKNIVILVLLILGAYFYFNSPVITEIKEVVTVEERIVIVKDSTETKEIGAPEIKYIPRDMIVYRDSIVYLKKDDTTAIKVNEYNELLKTDNVTARLKILTTGELKKVFGKFDTKEKIKTVTTLKKKYVQKSNIYLGGYVGISNNQNDIDFSFTMDYSIKNKYILGAKYSPFTGSYGIKFGIKMF